MVEEVPLKVALKQPVRAEQWELDTGVAGIKCEKAAESNLNYQRIECRAGFTAAERDGMKLYVRCSYGMTLVEDK